MITFAKEMFSIIHFKLTKAFVVNIITKLFAYILFWDILLNKYLLEENILWFFYTAVNQLSYRANGNDVLISFHLSARDILAIREES